MKPHVELVGVLFIIWGALTALVGLSTLALGVAAASLITSEARGGPSRQFAARLEPAPFTAPAINAIGWGAAHIVVAVPWRRRNPLARLFALMLGSVDLVLLPYGTA